MQDICQFLLRNLCCCLIKKQIVQYHHVNQQKNKFLSLAENNNQDLLIAKSQQQDYKQQMSSSIINKTVQFLTEDDQSDIHKTQKQTNLIQVEQTHKQHKDQIKDYSNVIAQDHPYYHLFKEKINILGKIFDIPNQAHSIEPDTQYPLKMYCYQEGKYNIFKYFFEFPTDYHTYEAISNDFEFQKQTDSNIDQFKKILETPGGDAKLIYLSYKKVLIMSSRDFEYVRYTFKKDNQFWNVCVSDMSREQIAGKVRGQMILTATRIVQKGGKIQISVSSQTDMKIPIKLQMAKNRGFAEIRKYLDKIYAHIKHNEQQKSII